MPKKEKKSKSDKAVQKTEPKANKKAAEKPAKKAGAKAQKKLAKKSDKATRKSDKAASKKSAKQKAAGVSAVPPGMHTVTPSLTFKDAAKAIEFYRAAFGATELTRMLGPDGKSTWHAAIRIGDSVLHMNDESPMGVVVAAASQPRATFSLQLYVERADEWFDRAIAAGAKSTMPMTDMFWGDRMGMVSDPFGIYWMIATRVSSPNAEQLEAATKEALRQAHAQGDPSEGHKVAADKTQDKAQDKHSDKDEAPSA